MLCNLSTFIDPIFQGQTAFDVADEDVLGYLEELQKKQNLASHKILLLNKFATCLHESCMNLIFKCVAVSLLKDK